MSEKQMREAFAAQSVEVELDKELIPPSMYWFYSGWSAALSQPAPQGVAEVMHLVEKYASDTADFVLVGSPVSSCEPIEQAITAIITERDALRARAAELEKDAAAIDWLESRINEDGEIHLHDGKHPYGNGLGLRHDKSIRSLRKAIDDASKEAK